MPAPLIRQNGQVFGQLFKLGSHEPLHDGGVGVFVAFGVGDGVSDGSGVEVGGGPQAAPSFTRNVRAKFLGFIFNNVALLHPSELWTGTSTVSRAPLKSTSFFIIVQLDDMPNFILNEVEEGAFERTFKVYFLPGPSVDVAARSDELTI